MDKHELVGITLQQLLEHFKMSPESFEYYDYTNRPANTNAKYHYPCILWQPRVQLGDVTSNVVQDPNNSHAVVVSFDESEKTLICYVFLKAPSNLATASLPPVADSIMYSKRRFEKWRSNYKKFKKLRDLIKARDKRKENLTYLTKLTSVFPDTMDHHLLDE